MANNRRSYKPTARDIAYSIIFAASVDAFVRFLLPNHISVLPVFSLVIPISSGLYISCAIAFRRLKPVIEKVFLDGVERRKRRRNLRRVDRFLSRALKDPFLPDEEKEKLQKELAVAKTRHYMEMIHGLERVDSEWGP